ncbi:hypothetical protein B7463_g1712, partial [Scytalidium lignicola]
MAPNSSTTHQDQGHSDKSEILCDKASDHANPSSQSNSFVNVARTGSDLFAAKYQSISDSLNLPAVVNAARSLCQHPWAQQLSRIVKSDKPDELQKARSRDSFKFGATMINALRSPSSGMGRQSLFGSTSSSSDGDNTLLSDKPTPPASSHFTSNLDERAEEAASYLSNSSSSSTMDPPLSRTASDNMPQLSLPHSQPSTAPSSGPRPLPKLLPLIRSPPDMNHSFVSTTSQQITTLPPPPVEPSISAPVLNTSYDGEVALVKRKGVPSEGGGLVKKQKLDDSASFGSTSTLAEASSNSSVVDNSKPGGVGDVRKRKKAASGDQNGTRKRRADKDGQSPSPRKRNRPSKKPKKGESAKEKLSQDIWMRILEYTPPQFLSKMRLVNKEFKEIVDKFDSIYINCRKENYGYDMPSPPEGLTERQYSNLLAGKGCMEPDCEDKNSSKTHWSWLKRWCLRCWKKKIIREDRIIKYHSGNLSRQTVMDLLECIPVGMHDSFEKPHDYIEDPDARTRVISRMYHCYVREDFLRIKAEYEALDPGPYKEDTTLSSEEQAAAQAAHQKLVDTLDSRRTEFITTRQDKAAEHMEKVMKIEEHVRAKRESVKDPNAANRQARRELFTRRAREDLPHIDETFVQKTEAFKAATRIFRDPGSERGWKALRPKIEAEWEKAHGKDADKSMNEHEVNGLATSKHETTGPNSNGGSGATDPGSSMQSGAGNNANLPTTNRNPYRGSSVANSLAALPYNQVFFRGTIPRRSLPRGVRTVVRYASHLMPNPDIPSILNDPNLPPGVGIAVMSNPTAPPPPGMQTFSLPPITAGSSFSQTSGQFNPSYHQGAHNYGNQFAPAHSSAPPQSSLGLHQQPPGMPQSSSSSFQSSSTTSRFPPGPPQFPSVRPQFPMAAPANYPPIPRPPPFDPPHAHSIEEYQSLYNQFRAEHTSHTSHTTASSTWDMMTSAARPRGQQHANGFMGGNGGASSSGRQQS